MRLDFFDFFLHCITTRLSYSFVTIHVCEIIIDLEYLKGSMCNEITYFRSQFL
jgi:hypothetical protein